MEYLYLGITILTALLLMEIISEAWVFYLTKRATKKRKQAFENLQNRILSTYADVDRVDDLAEEWRGE